MKWLLTYCKAILHRQLTTLMVSAINVTHLHMQRRETSFTTLKIEKYTFPT